MFIMFILMFLPVIALPVFWYLLLEQAVPVYLVCLSLSVWMFWLMRRNRKYRIVTGKEGMIGQEAEVVSKSTAGGRARYTTHIKDELWTAWSYDDVGSGDKVIITAIEGSTPIIKRKDNGMGTGGLS